MNGLDGTQGKSEDQGRKSPLFGGAANRQSAEQGGFDSPEITLVRIGAEVDLKKIELATKVVDLLAGTVSQPGVPVEVQARVLMRLFDTLDSLAGNPTKGGKGDSSPQQARKVAAIPTAIPPANVMPGLLKGGVNNDESKSS